VTKCSVCGKETTDLRAGVCFDCAEAAEAKAAGEKPPEPPDASAAAATMARAKARAEAERKTSAPVTRGDLHDLEAGLRREFGTKAEPVAAEPKKAGGSFGVVAGVVVALVVIAGVAAVVIFKPFLPKGA
jgi:hypothetical protein